MKKVLLILLICLTGCNQQNETKVWGRGELPDDYVSFFGSDNTSRLNKAQNDLLNKHEVLFRGIDVNDANGVKVHRSGLVDFVVSLVNRVTELEQFINDPNKVVLCDTKYYETNWDKASDGFSFSYLGFDTNEE